MYKRIFTLLILACASFSLYAQRQLIFTGTFDEPGSKGIYVLEFDEEKESLRIIQTMGGMESPNFLSVHPSGRFLFSANRNSVVQDKPWGSLSSFAIDNETGKLTLINERPAYGPGTCYIATDDSGKWLFIANYNGGNLAAYPVHEDGNVGEVTAVIQLEGKSVHPSRQTQSHLHAAAPGPDNDHVFFPDLGTDKIMIYRLDRETGQLTPGEQPWIKTAPGSGPRHFTFHPSGRFAYLAEELSSTVSGYRYDAKEGRLSELQRLSTLPRDFEGENTNADIHVHPNGKYLYVSNRGHNSIAIFAIDQQSGRLTLKGFENTRGEWPRNFMIHPEGNYLFVANQHTDNVTLFRINPDTGALTFTGNEIEIPSPVCLKYLKSFQE